MGVVHDICKAFNKCAFRGFSLTTDVEYQGIVFHLLDWQKVKYTRNWKKAFVEHLLFISYIKVLLSEIGARYW